MPAKDLKVLDELLERHRFAIIERTSATQGVIDANTRESKARRELREIETEIDLWVHDHDPQEKVPTKI
jgi:hypothetical protein